MLTKYYAHSHPHKPEELKAHLLEVAERSQAFAGKFGAADLGYLAGLLHDIGKYSAEFQAKLNGGKQDAPHSVAGAKLAQEHYGSRIGRMLGFAIAGHHAGLANGIADGKGQTRRPLRERLEDTDKKACPDFSAYRGEIEVLPPTPSFPKLMPYRDAEFRERYGGVCASLFIRMLFSCLVDADRLATETFYDEDGGAAAKRAAWAKLDELKPLLDAHLAEKQAKARVNPPDVNQKRAEVLAAAREKAKLPPGIFTLTVPTGGGKTLSSLAFALDHAHHHAGKFDRVIYVIPFTSIIEQTAEVFRDVFGRDDAVLEHHSAFDEEALIEKLRGSTFEGEFDADGALKLRLATENWDAPIVVTTAVQFFESLFASAAGKCRKLHNIARSIIILDEAQTLPLPLLRPCIAALDELARNYGCTIVLCTATQPALVADEAGKRGFRGGFYGVREIAPHPEALYRDLRRVTVRYIGAQSDEALAQCLAENEQVLCIVNTRLHARELYERLGAGPGNYHLSALMCARHRAERLAEIKRRLADGQPCRVVTTTLIEAGVDVDFPVVYRAEMGLDSIAQAAGRCNREGRRQPEESFVYVFKPEERKPPAELKQYAEIASRLLAGMDDPLLPEAIERYFREVYWLRENDGTRDGDLDRYEILEDLRPWLQELWFPFETVSRKFKIIKDGQKPIIIPYDARAEELLARLAALGFEERLGDIPRKLQPYVVTVPPYAFAELQRVDAVQLVNEKRLGGQFWKLANRELYRPDIGLLFDDPTFRRAESTLF